MKEKLVELLKQCVMQNITLELDCWDAIDVNYGKMADSLMESGVIVLPCKVGDTVYKTVRTFVGEWDVWEIRIEHIALYFGTIGGCDTMTYAIGCTQDGSAVTTYFDTIGKTVFLTREEAEAALKEGQ